LGITGHERELKASAFNQAWSFAIDKSYPVLCRKYVISPLSGVPDQIVDAPLAYAPRGDWM
jgi:hypothetical protein